MNCRPYPDQTITIDGGEVVWGDGGLVPDDGGARCTTYVDSATCTLSTSCGIPINGLLDYTISLKVTFNGSSATGTETIWEYDLNGFTYVRCTYDVTLTKN
jgi:hypothetical protein